VVWVNPEAGSKVYVSAKPIPEPSFLNPPVMNTFPPPPAAE
jgi:hypothetical protein